MKKNSVDIMKIREFFQKYGYNPRAKKDSGMNNLYFTVFVLVLKKEGSMIKYDYSGFGHGFWFWLCHYVTVMRDHHLFIKHCARCGADWWCKTKTVLALHKI